MNYDAESLALSSFDRIGKQSAVRASERANEWTNEQTFASRRLCQLGRW